MPNPKTRYLTTKIRVFPKRSCFNVRCYQNTANHTVHTLTLNQLVSLGFSENSLNSSQYSTAEYFQWCYTDWNSVNFNWISRTLTDSNLECKKLIPVLDILIPVCLSMKIKQGKDVICFFFVDMKNHINGELSRRPFILRISSKMSKLRSTPVFTVKNNPCFR